MLRDSYLFLKMLDESGVTGDFSADVAVLSLRRWIVVYSAVRAGVDIADINILYFVSVCQVLLRGAIICSYAPGRASAVPPGEPPISRAGYGEFAR